MDDMTEAALPVSGLLAWWASAWLRGTVDTDSVLDHLLADTQVHSVRSLPSSGWNVEGTGLLPLLALLRREGARAVGMALPDPGDLAGLAGPTEFNHEAVEVGEAFVAPLLGLGAVPHHVGAGVTWTLHRINRRPPPDVGEADRLLRGQLNGVVDGLVSLDVTSWSPRTADELLNLMHAPDVSPPPGTPPVAAALAARALHLRTIVRHALLDAAAGVTLHEHTRRNALLEELDRVARHALVAACSSDAWPED